MLFVGLIFGMIVSGKTLQHQIFCHHYLLIHWYQYYRAFYFPVLAVLVYKSLWKVPQGPRLIVSAFMGTIFHTCMVMGLIYVLYSNMFAEAMHLSADQVLGTILILSATHGIPEAIFAGVIVTPMH